MKKNLTKSKQKNKKKNKTKEQKELSKTKITHPTKTNFVAGFFFFNKKLPHTSTLKAFNYVH